MVGVQNLGTAIDILSIRTAFLQPILQCLIRGSYNYYNKFSVPAQAFCHMLFFGSSGPLLYHGKRAPKTLFPRLTCLFIFKPGGGAERGVFL